MKTKKIVSTAFATAVSLAMASPSILAGTTAVSDSQLDAVSGMGNISTVGASDSTTVNGSTLGGNVQVGYFQWDDNHGSDTSLNKGGNVQGGAESQVQQNATVDANGLAWGGMAQSITVNTGSTVGSNQALESWWIMYIGGF